jgi:hypothetical protein
LYATDNARMKARIVNTLSNIGGAGSTSGS